MSQPGFTGSYVSQRSTKHVLERSPCSVHFRTFMLVESRPPANTGLTHSWAGLSVQQFSFRDWYQELCSWASTCEGSRRVRDFGLPLRSRQHGCECRTCQCWALIVLNSNKASTSTREVSSYPIFGVISPTAYDLMDSKIRDQQLEAVGLRPWIRGPFHPQPRQKSRTEYGPLETPKDFAEGGS